MSALDCDCADLLNDITNDPCSAVDYGSQIVKIFIQKMDGTTFDGTVGNDATVEADWDSRIAAVDDDKIAVLRNVTGIRPSVAPNLETGQDVPYGGSEAIDRDQNIDFNQKYYSQTSFAEADQVACWPKVRFWYLTNKDWLFGEELAVAATSGGNGVEDANVIMSTFGQAGIGTKNKAETNQILWNNLCQPHPVGKFPFLKTK